MTPPEPPTDEPDRDSDPCDTCGYSTCECDRAYETYQDLEDPR